MQVFYPSAGGLGSLRGIASGCTWYVISEARGPRAAGPRHPKGVEGGESFRAGLVAPTKHCACLKVPSWLKAKLRLSAFDAKVDEPNAKSDVLDAKAEGGSQRRLELSTNLEYGANL